MKLLMVCSGVPVITVGFNDASNPERNAEKGCIDAHARYPTFPGARLSTANTNLASAPVHTAFVINMAGRRAAVEESRRRCTPIRDDYAERAVQFTSYHCRPRERREGVVENQMAQIHKVWNKNLVEANNWIKLPFCRSLQWIPVSRI